MKKHYWGIFLFIAISSLLFTGCGAAIFEGLLGAAAEEAVVSTMARGVVANVARRTVMSSIARAGVRYAAVEAGAGAATIAITDEVLLNATLSRMALGAGSMLLIPLDNNTTLKAKVVDSNTIRVNGEDFDVPGNIYVVNTENLNVRSGPSIAYAVVATLGKKKVVFVDETTSDGWAKVNYGYNSSGYMKAHYLSPVH